MYYGAPMLNRKSPCMRQSSASEGLIPLEKASLFFREIGQGPPIIVLHGGPDFDHDYLLPDIDRLANAFRLIYYDQRGRGRSSGEVRPEDVSLASDLKDLDRVREHFQLESTAVLGHSWGAILALEYALRHPTRVSHLILMNPAPASARDRAISREAYSQKLGADMDRQAEITAGPAYKQGDPAAVAARYRLHFKHALAQLEDYERLMETMKAGFMRQGMEGILKASWSCSKTAGTSPISNAPTRSMTRSTISLVGSCCKFFSGKLL